MWPCGLLTQKKNKGVKESSEKSEWWRERGREIESNGVMAV